ncbi:uncharacterized protein LOC132262081 [Phlebotomus argentipes]|uniref:uncharacterized protein LOC132262081 n=1 Tax=Phlebotomus argentipes TaxID=94469 RepID=UPI0028937CE2|nr:uncharacterized protein LOC132262081 [Phlebotomus argentipes]
MERALLYTLLVILGLTQASALTCYNCNSLQHKDCANSLDTVEKVTCHAGENCASVFFTLQPTPSSAPISTVIRGCASNKVKCSDLEQNTEQVVTDCTLCDKDLCNNKVMGSSSDSVKLSSAIFSVFPLLIAAMLINHWQ